MDQTRRIIWSLPNEAFERLLSLSEAHIKLVKESLLPCTTMSRKDEIRRQIERIRNEYETILNRHKGVVMDGAGSDKCT